MVCICLALKFSDTWYNQVYLFQLENLEKLENFAKGIKI